MVCYYCYLYDPVILNTFYIYIYIIYHVHYSAITVGSFGLDAPQLNPSYCQFQLRRPGTPYRTFGHRTSL